MKFEHDESINLLCIDMTAAYRYKLFKKKKKSSTF
jgi:hypothetical protein